MATYASRCIENEILMYLRRNSKTRSEVSFDEPLNIDWDGNELLLSDVLGTENDTIYRNIEEQVDRKLLQKALEKLSERERLIMELRFGLRGEKKKRKGCGRPAGYFPILYFASGKRIIKRLRKEFNKMV